MKDGSAIHGAPSRATLWPALLLYCATVLLLGLSAPHIGVTWDEPVYLVASETYVSWFGKLLMQPSVALSREEVATHWGVQHEHPPFGKLWGGLVWLGARHLFDDLTAHRMGNILLSAALVSLLYLMLAREHGMVAGMAGAAALLTMPRFFFHAHLATLDVPVALMIFAATCVFWLGHNQTGWRWTLLLGLTWGIGLSTKINALFVTPIVLSVWTLLFRRRRYLFTRLIGMSAIGMLIFFASWPWLYHATVHRVLAYWGFLTLGRYPTEQYYFGNLYAAPYTPLPWHYAFVMTAVVVPASLMLLAMLGACFTLRDSRERPFGALLFLGGLVSLLVLTSVWGQPFDNERLFMPAFPYIAALSGTGFAKIASIARRLTQDRLIFIPKTLFTSVLAVLAFGPQLFLASDLYPHLLSYYSEAMGGPYGGRVLQLETTYWCESYAQALSWLNTYASPQAVVWAECHDVLIYYQLQGRLRQDLQIAHGPDTRTVFHDVRLNSATFQEADYVVVQYRQSGHYRAIMEWMHARQPVYEWKYRRLRLMEIYQQDRMR
jgi:4-amino-4-deoxy-L-arabinose transferase-like glycosyltransferase